VPRAGEHPRERQAGPRAVRRGGGGARAAVQIREALPDARIVAISADDSQLNQYDMMRAGAVGFLSKGAPAEEVVRVIRSSARW
jgi:DNA-binding NarL/FixJ family response regulator